MNDFTKLNESIAKLGSALEAFWSGETPKRPPSDQPAIDAMTKQVEAIVASVPAPGTKLPIAKPGAPLNPATGKPYDPVMKPGTPTTFSPTSSAVGGAVGTSPHQTIVAQDDVSKGTYVKE